MISFIIILGLISLLIAIDTGDQSDPRRPPQTSTRERSKPATASTAGVAATILLGGCAAVPVHHQRLVSKPNMVFNDAGAFVYGPRVNAQLEPGAADSGGAVAAGCTACR